MDIIATMDSLIATAESKGRQPVNWSIPADEWQALAKRARAGDVFDPSAFGHNSYRGIPVHLANPDTRRWVGLFDREGEIAHLPKD